MMLPRKMFLDDMFDSFLESDTPKMKCDIYEKDGNYNLELDMPGFTKDDIDIEFNKGTLTISAEKNGENEEKNKNFIRQERFYGSMERKFYVGDIDESKVSAEFKDGVLKVVVPEENTTKSDRVIEIK